MGLKEDRISLIRESLDQSKQPSYPAMVLRKRIQQEYRYLKSKGFEFIAASVVSTPALASVTRLKPRYKPKAKRPLSGAYVYVWFDGEIPIYIGMSKTNDHRAFEKHSSKAEKLRQASKDFHCRCYDGLTDTGAKFLEGAMIRLLRPSGNSALGCRTRGSSQLTLAQS